MVYSNCLPAVQYTSPDRGIHCHADDSSAAEEGRAGPPSLYDANGNVDAHVFHTELAKSAAAARESQQESTLLKLRQHFQRVR